MPITLYRNNTCAVGADSSFPQSSSYTQKSVFGAKESFAYSAGSAQTLVVAQNTSNSAVTFPTGVTNANFVRVETDQPITVKLNGTGNFAIPVNPTSAGNGVLELSCSLITSVHLSTATILPASANVSVIICGGA